MLHIDGFSLLVGLIEFREWCNHTSGLDSSLAASSFRPALASRAIRTTVVVVVAAAAVAASLLRLLSLGLNPKDGFSRARHRRFFPRARPLLLLLLYTPSTISGI